MEVLTGLGEIHCSWREVAAVLRVSTETLSQFFMRHPEAKEAFEDAKESGKATLRRTQLQLAERNASMAIFLGKNLLAQKDDPNAQLPAPNPVNVQLSVEVNGPRERIMKKLSSIHRPPASPAHSDHILALEAKRLA